MPWSDWEVPGDQIEICKRPDGSDWELGAGAFGKVRLHASHNTLLTQPANIGSIILLYLHLYFTARSDTFMKQRDCLRRSSKH